MILLFLAIASVVLMLIYADIIVHITFYDWMLEYRYKLVYDIEFILPVTLPRVENLWVFFVVLGVVFVAFFVVLVDSKQGIGELYRGNRLYVVLPRRLGHTFWNDLVNAHSHWSMTQLPFIVARLVLVMAILKTLIGILLLVLSWLIPLIIGIFDSVVAYASSANDIGQTLFNYGIRIIKYMGNEFGVFLLLYAIIVIIAGYLHNSERSIYNDYAIMQRQRK